MSDSPGTTAAIRSTEANLPHCLRCNKPVDRLVISPTPNNPSMVTIEFECHGETVEQEMSSSLLAGEQSLGSYTAFNDFTSGLLPAETAKPAGKRSGRKKGKK